MSARREVRGPYVGWDARSGVLAYIHIGGDRLPDWLRLRTPVVLMHADDHAALLAEVERLRGELARRVDESAGAEATRREVERVALRRVTRATRRPTGTADAGWMNLRGSTVSEHTPDPSTDAPGHTVTWQRSTLMPDGWIAVPTDTPTDAEVLEALGDAATDADLADFYDGAEITEVDDD